jgi:glycosyltransferase involved in cell wall biosynthesis
LECARRGADRTVDLTLIDDTWDPRFGLALLPLGRRSIVVVHDSRPHDATHAYGGWQRHSKRALLRRADALACFSAAVERDLRRDHSKPIIRLPLTSDCWGIPEEPSQHARSGFVCLGRPRPYKNIRAVVEAWRRYRESAAYQGDELIVMGSAEAHGISSDTRREGVRWIPETLTYPDMLRVLRGAKANVCFYRAASQSGVQILAAQHGVATIASTVGGLGEYQTHGAPVVSRHDLDGLARAFAELSDPAHAHSVGMAARDRFLAEWTPDHVAASLLDQVNSVWGAP